MNEGMNPALERGAEVLARGYGWRHGGRKDPVLNGLNLRIPAGQRVLLLGASGSGKSTLLAAIAGVLGDEDGDQQGSITVGGVAPENCRGRVGMVLQDPDSQVIAQQVGDDVVFGCENLGVSREEMWQRAAHAIDVVGLDLPLEHPTRALSGGQKQRLALAGVIAMRPGVIVLDEPTANLDPVGVQEVRRAVLRAVEDTGATLIVVEHRTEIWKDAVDRVIVLGSEGTIVADDAPDLVLMNHAERLAEMGVWVPGVPVDVKPITEDRVSTSSVGELRPSRGSVAKQSDATLLTTDGLAIGWDPDTPPVCSDLNLQLQQGSTVLTGPNGAGKSTLALTLGGLLAPRGGEVDASGLMEIVGKRWRGGVGKKKHPHPHTWRSKQLIRHIGYVFQDPEHQFAARSVREELLVGPRVTGMDPAEAEAHADELLEAVGLTRLGPANPYTLSGGEKRRLSVISMLTTRPGLLILDEPTFGQDRRTFSALVQLLQGLAEDGVSLLSISHDATYAQLMGEHEWRLGDE